ncbi:MAG: hypothetical protein QMC36_04615 [Patescibacteria group bacterium]
MVVGTFSQTLSCTAAASSSTATPNVDEDCNGTWDNTSSATVTTICAYEGGTCSFAGTKTIVYYCPGGNATS